MAVALALVPVAADEAADEGPFARPVRGGEATVVTTETSGCEAMDHTAPPFDSVSFCRPTMR